MLKSLTRYRFDKVKERGKLKQSILCLVPIVFPEFEKMAPSLHIPSVYTLRFEFPRASKIAFSHLSRLSNLLKKSSKCHYCKNTAIMLRESTKTSIGLNIIAKSLKLKHTIKLIQELDSRIEEIENEIKTIMDEINSPIESTTVLEQ